MNGIYKSVYSLKPGKDPGSHTQIFSVAPGRFAAIIEQWHKEAEDRELDASDKKRIERFTRYFCNRFLLKIGRTDNFAMRLGTSKPVNIARSDVSEVFGSIGYSLFPTWRKTKDDSLEAAREIPYFFHGKRGRLFLPDLSDFLVQYLQKKVELEDFKGENAIFLIKNIRKEKRYTIYDLYREDRYIEDPPSCASEFKQKMEEIRATPLDAKTSDKLREFFDARFTVGVRDTIRWLGGERHPGLNWEEARNLINDCFVRHGGDNFLLAELNYYLPAPNYNIEEIQRINRSNIEFIKIASSEFRALMSEKEKKLFSNKFIRELFMDIFNYHHGYPRYILENMVGYLNPVMGKTSLKFAEYLIYQFADIKFPVRRNSRIDFYLEKKGWKSKISNKLAGKAKKIFLNKIYGFVLQYDLVGGIRYEDTVYKWNSYKTTFCTVQEKADYLKPSSKKITHFSLEDLSKTEYSFYLRKYPELSEKLVVFFVLVLRFFLDTDFIPDLRPEEAGINIFILGIWGYITENLLIILYENENGEEKFKIKFVDNKDHFKQYKRQKDKEEPLGIAKHALRFVEPVILPAMLRAIGNFVQITWENRNGLDEMEIDMKGLVDYTVTLAQEVLVKSIDSSLVGMKELTIDSFDDLQKIIKKLFTSNKKNYKEI